MSIQSTRGAYIVIDGIDGGGKTSIFEKLNQALEKQPFDLGYDRVRLDGLVRKYSIFTREPGGTRLAERMREMILKEPMSAFSELCMFFAQRDDVRKQVIEPALHAGVNVISDRSDSASFAYQLRGRQLVHLEDLYWQTRPMMAPLPDFYLFLDLDPKVAYERMTKDSRVLDNFESQQIDFFERVRNGYKEFAQKVEAPCHFVNAEQSKEAVAAEVLQIVQEYLGIKSKIVDNVVPLARQA